MIARLQGTVLQKNASTVVISAGGVGYEVFIPLSTFYDLPKENEAIDLHIKTVVRDDAIELFGFLTPGEKDAFLLLNTVSKIGPRLALSILSGIGPRELVEAVRSRNVNRLHSVPGVGAKTAERLILELKDKVARLAFDAALPSAADEKPLDAIEEDVVSALLNLGYKAAEAEKAVRTAQTEPGLDPADLAGLLRRSLKRLQKT